MASDDENWEECAHPTSVLDISNVLFDNASEDEEEEAEMQTTTNVETARPSSSIYEDIAARLGVATGSDSSDDTRADSPNASDAMGIEDSSQSGNVFESKSDSPADEQSVNEDEVSRQPLADVTSKSNTPPRVPGAQKSKAPTGQKRATKQSSRSKKDGNLTKKKLLDLQKESQRLLRESRIRIRKSVESTDEATDRRRTLFSSLKTKLATRANELSTHSHATSAFLEKMKMLNAENDWKEVSDDSDDLIIEKDESSSEEEEELDDDDVEDEETEELRGEDATSMDGMAAADTEVASAIGSVNDTDDEVTTGKDGLRIPRTPSRLREPMDPTVEDVDDSEPADVSVAREAGGRDTPTQEASGFRLSYSLDAESPVDSSQSTSNGDDACDEPVTNLVCAEAEEGSDCENVVDGREDGEEEGNDSSDNCDDMINDDLTASAVEDRSIYHQVDAERDEEEWDNIAEFMKSGRRSKGRKQRCRIVHDDFDEDQEEFLDEVAKQRSRRESRLQERIDDEDELEEPGTPKSLSETESVESETENISDDDERRHRELLEKRQWHLARQKTDSPTEESFAELEQPSTSMTLKRTDVVRVFKSPIRRPRLQRRTKSIPLSGQLAQKDSQQDAVDSSVAEGSRVDIRSFMAADPAARSEDTATKGGPRLSEIDSNASKTFFSTMRRKIEQSSGSGFASATALGKRKIVFTHKDPLQNVPALAHRHATGSTGSGKRAATKASKLLHVLQSNSISK